jgi:hypothetical protein
MLYGLIPYRPDMEWNDFMARQVRAFIDLEHPAPQSLTTLLTYPILATFDGLPNWEAGRTGLGPLPVLLLPFALAGFWSDRKTARSSPLITVFVACLVAYAIWMLAGPSQRVRHLLPLMAPATLVLTVAAWRAVDKWPGLKHPLTAGLIAVVLLQLAGQAVFSLKNLRYVLGERDRAAYLDAQIPYAPIAQWLNSHLTSTDKVATTKREMVYLIDVPVQMAAWLDGRIRMDEIGADTPSIVARLHDQAITHLVADLSQGMPLVAAGCARLAAQFDIAPLASRTLRLRSDGDRFAVAVFEMTYPDCRF